MTAHGCAFLVGVLCFVASSPPAEACRCVEPSAAKAYALGDVVVVGRVESVEKHGDLFVATLAVERAWKGDVANRIRIVFGGTCSFVLETLERYLLYPTRAGDGSYGIRRCRGDQLYGRAARPLAWLGKHGKASLVR